MKRFDAIKDEMLFGVQGPVKEAAAISVLLATMSSSAEKVVKNVRKMLKD